MVVRFPVALFLCLVLAVGPALAENDERHQTPPPAASATTPPPVTVVVDIAIPPQQPNEDETDRLRAMYAEAHEAMEGDDEQAPFWRRWAQNFNYRRIALNAHRWYLLHSGEIQARDHAANLAIMFLTSHTIETVTGMAMASAGVSPDADLSWPLRVVLATVGIGITMPGLDPLCLALGAAYFRWPRTMNRALTIPRVIVVNVGGTITRYLGVNAVFNYMITRRDGAAFLRETLERGVPGIYRWTATATGFDFSLADAHGGLAARLEMHRHGTDALALGTLTLATGDLSPAARAHLANHLRPFGSNVRDAVLEAFDAARGGRLTQLQERRYVEAEGVDSSRTDALVVRFRQPAIRVGPHRTIRPWQWFKDIVRRLACAEYLIG